MRRERQKELEKKKVESKNKRIFVKQKKEENKQKM